MMNLRGFVIVCVSLLVAAVAPQLLIGSAPDLTRKCLSLLIVSAMWWIGEPFPSYVTSLAVVTLSVGLGILNGKAAAAAFFDPVMFLFISGFSLASAMEKYQITRRLSTPLMRRILASADKRGGDLMFHMGISVLCVLLSAVVSNVAASVLVASIGKTVAASLMMEPRAQKRLFLTIAFASNVGGMVVPIASPQNLIALSILKSASNISIGFMEWLQFSGPLCLLTLLIIYIVLRRRFGVSRLAHGYGDGLSVMHHKRFDDDDDEDETESMSGGKRGAVSGLSQFAVSVIVCGTVVGWCFFEQFKLDTVFHHMGIFGLISVVLLHAIGFSDQSDWQSLPWPILTLLGGGMVLGESVEQSGLLNSLTDVVMAARGDSSPFIIYSITLCGIGLVANFLSSTVCALITLPVIAKVGTSLGHPRLFVMAAALMTSGAMALQ